MIKNFCDKCGQEISLDDHGHLQLSYHTINQRFSDCETKILYYDLCDKCEIEIKNLIDEIFKQEGK